MLVAFDIDGTLIDAVDKPRQDVLDLLKWFQSHNCEVVVWSGGGLDYVKTWISRLGLTNVRVGRKFVDSVDIAVDDMGDEITSDKLKAKVIIKV